METFLEINSITPAAVSGRMSIQGERSGAQLVAQSYGSAEAISTGHAPAHGSVDAIVVDTTGAYSLTLADDAGAVTMYLTAGPLLPIRVASISSVPAGAHVCGFYLRKPA